MLTAKKITIEARSVVDGVEIAGHRAIFSSENNGVTFLPWQIDKDACEAHRKTVREDRDAFEDFAYDMKKKIFEQGEA